MNELQIRRSLPEDLERVRTAYATWGYNGGVQPNDVVFLAERDGRLLGLVRRTIEHDTLMLRGIQVSPDTRGQGIGARLLDAFVTGLEGRECYCIPYVHLVEFYRRQGFEIRSTEGSPAFLGERITGYQARGLDVLLMRRPAWWARR